jgi:hypothetical protein
MVPDRPTSLAQVLGTAPAQVRTWFDTVLAAELPLADGSLAAEREAAAAYARMAKAENTRRAYRAAVRAWCDWCQRRDLPGTGLARHFASGGSYSELIAW